MKTLLSASLIALALGSYPVVARQSILPGASDPSTQAVFLVAAAVYGPGDRAQVHDGWG